MKYIPADKLIAEIERRITETEELGELGRANELLMLETFITSLQQEQPMPDSTELIAKWEEEKDVLKQMGFRGDEWRLAQNAFLDGVGIGLSVKQEQPDNMIQWTGNNLKEVIDFTGKSPRFGEWFKSWEDFENYVHSHGNILKLFCEDGSHYEVPTGAWIVKTPDGYNLPSVSRFVQEQPEVDLEKEYSRYVTSRKDDLSGNAVTINMKDLARHFYELGQRNKYQQDRAEFAKLKAKEWQSGYNEGYAKGFNSRKEE